MLMFRSLEAEATLSANGYTALVEGVLGEGVGAGGEAPAIRGAEGLPLIVKVPTPVIWGEKDQALLTGNLEGLDRFAPRLAIQRIPDHWVPHEQPARINALLRAFITGKRAP
jgi:pimeloyl-ACP methyl ester carboxylesterase